MAKVRAKALNALDSKLGYLLQAVLALLAAYLVASRAIDTGSLIEYFVTFACIFFGINRLIKLTKSYF